MAYNVGDRLIGKGILGDTRHYQVTKVTAKSVIFHLVNNGTVLENCRYQAKPEEDGTLRIRATSMRDIKVRKA